MSVFEGFFAGKWPGGVERLPIMVEYKTIIWESLKLVGRGPA